MWKVLHVVTSRSRALRFADLFGRAVDRLGDPRPPIRVGALRMLELLGDDNPAHRQAIVDVICGYLRMPANDDRPTRQMAVQILASHLRRDDRDPHRFWAGVGLDLTGAVLVDFDLADCRIDGDLRLDHVIFLGPARLRGITVGGSVGLRGAAFHDHAWLERATLCGPYKADGAVFRADAWFGAATFLTRASFAGVEFGGHAWFGGSTFRGPVSFEQAVFRRSAGFRGVVAHTSVGLSGATFLGPARVSRRGEAWSVLAPGWRVVVDTDNESVGQLLWVGGIEAAGLPEVTPGR
jgi:hypothetical protein